MEMRLWSIHPKFLDAKGIVALWREGLLAQKVLIGQTKGYRNHPQLDRFKKKKDPVLAIGNYLWHVAHEAKQRGYSFDESKILKTKNLNTKIIPVTEGQLEYERQHLMSKLKIRDPERFKKLNPQKKLDPHVIFKVTPGKVEEWEKF